MSRLTLLLCLFGLTCSQGKAIFAELGTEAIVGGHYAEGDKFKYQVALLSGGEYLCGGVIIDKFYILTAAHCVAIAPQTILQRSYTVMAGTHDVKNKHAAIFDHVETIYIPKELKLSASQHDIAILKLKNGLDLSGHHHKIIKVNLPHDNADFDHVTAVVSGFGAQSLKIIHNKEGILERYDYKQDYKLKYADAKVMSNAKCTELIKVNVHSTWMCAQIVHHGKHHGGVCLGDSGGPLVHENLVIGIVSAVKQTCNDTKSPTIYTRISSYRNMIHNVITGKPGNDVIPVKAVQ